MGLSINNQENQFEWQSELGSGVLEYSRQGDKIYLLHTEVPLAQQGKGVATELVKRSLDYIRSQGLVVMPHCSFVRKFIDNHSDYHDLLSEGYRL